MALGSRAHEDKEALDQIKIAIQFTGCGRFLWVLSQCHTSLDHDSFNQRHCEPGRGMINSVHYAAMIKINTLKILAYIVIGHKLQALQYAYCHALNSLLWKGFLGLLQVVH